MKWVTTSWTNSNRIRKINLVLLFSDSGKAFDQDLYNINMRKKDNLAGFKYPI